MNNCADCGKINQECICPIPRELELIFHKGCSRAHWTMREIRKCAGHFVHADSVINVKYSLNSIKKGLFA